jgi:hypothetical protein
VFGSRSTGMNLESSGMSSAIVRVSRPAGDGAVRSVSHVDSSTVTFGPHEASGVACGHTPNLARTGCGTLGEICRESGKGPTDVGIF